MSEAPRKPYHPPRVDRFTEEELLSAIERQAKVLAIGSQRLTRLLGLLRVLQANKGA